MQFSVERKYLFPLLERVRGAFGVSLSSIDKPSMLLIEVKDNTLLLRGCDHAISITETTSHVSIKESGACIVPGLLLREWLHHLSENIMLHIHIASPAAQNSTNESDQENATFLNITTEKSFFRLRCLPPEDFPSIEAGENVSSFFMSTVAFSDALRKTVFATSTDPNRYYLNGVYLHKYQQEGHKICLCTAATDGHRLAVHTLDFQDEEPKDFEGVIVSRRAMDHLLGILDVYQRQNKNADTLVHISIHENIIRFAIDDLEFLSKLIDGRFPDYRKVVPKESKCYLTQEAKPLAQIVNRMLAVGSKKKETTIILDMKEGDVKFKAEGGYGETEEEADGQYQGKPLTVALNGIYLSDIIRCFPTDTLRLEMKDKSSPLIIRSHKYKDSLHVIMPIAL